MTRIYRPILGGDGSTLNTREQRVREDEDIFIDGLYAVKEKPLSPSSTSFQAKYHSFLILRP